MNYQRVWYIISHKIPWWFLHRFHPKHRYHVIKTGLKPGWVDRDTLLEHMMIKILRDFVEKEKPFEYFDTENSPNSEEWMRLKNLYQYFKDNYPMDSHHSIPYKVLTEKLVELVNLRRLLWT